MSLTTISGPRDWEILRRLRLPSAFARAQATRAPIRKHRLRAPRADKIGRSAVCHAPCSVPSSETGASLPSVWPSRPMAVPARPTASMCLEALARPRNGMLL